MKEYCALCEKELHKFMTTPLLRDEENGSLHSICEECADEYFPGWDDEEEWE